MEEIEEVEADEGNKTASARGGEMRIVGLVSSAFGVAAWAAGG